MADRAQEPDVIDELTTDHREAKELLYDARSETEPSRRRELADQMIAELVRHSVAEEMYVYPAMRDYLPDGQQVVDHDVDEHTQLERLMKELERTDPDDVEFTALLGQIERALEDHARAEETQQFPAMRLHVPAKELAALKDKVDRAKKLSPTRPHPGAPNSELFHKVVGPGVGLVDRLRDALAARARK